MKVFVTGASGFVGSNLVKRLLKDGHEVQAIFNSGENAPPDGVEVFHAGLTGVDWPIITRPDVVFHQAANNDTRCDNYYQMWQANVYDTLTLFRKMYEKGCRKFVYASSTAVYGDSQAPYHEESTPLNPLNVYAKSKVAMEDGVTAFAKRTGCTVIGLRYCNVYGPGEGHKGKRMSMVGQMIRTLKQYQKVRLFTSGNQKRDWMYVDDAVEGNICAMRSDVSGIYNLGSGTAVAFYDLTRTIVSTLNPVPVNPSNWIEFIEHPFPDQYQNHTECNVEKARRMLSYVPSYDIKKGVVAYLSSLSGSSDLCWSCPSSPPTQLQRATC